MKWLLIASLILPFAGNDFDYQLITKLSEMMKTEVPAIIQIEYLPQKEMREVYKDKQYRKCVSVSDIPPGPGRIKCVVDDGSLHIFSFGWWLWEENPQHLHILLYKRGGIESIVHEWVHWWLYNQTSPPGIFDEESVILPAVDSIMISPEFNLWLEGVERKEEKKLVGSLRIKRK